MMAQRTIPSVFERLWQMIQAASPHIREAVYDTRLLIQEKTERFVDRALVLEPFYQFLAEQSQGYFIIRGDPGIGKTAVAAHIVKETGAIHHFNSRPQRINTAEKFLRNICSQLIAVYNLPYPTLPPEAVQDSGFLVKLLTTISAQLKPQDKLIIIVDALDEIDMVDLPVGTNPLYLPQSLPKGVYFLVTRRRDPLLLQIACEQQIFDVEQDDPDNQADIKRYIQQEIKELNIQPYIQVQNITKADFIRYLVQKSQGNFMYIRYVLPEITKGGYQSLHLDQLPLGLMAYYEDHWQRMKRREGEEIWFNYELPVLMAILVSKEPISKALIARFSKVADQRRITAVLQQWDQFLYKINVPYEGDMQMRYRIYHASFHDFIDQKEEIADERVNRQQAREQETSILLSLITKKKNKTHPTKEGVDTQKLYNILLEGFNEQELKDLCLNLRVNYEDLSAVDQQNKVRELISYFSRRKELPRLQSYLYLLRPHYKQ